MGHKSALHTSHGKGANGEVKKNVLDDLSKPKNAAQKVEYSIEELPMGYMEIDISTMQVLSVNQSFCEYSGCSKVELSSTNALEWAEKAGNPELVSLLKLLASGKEPPEVIPYNFPASNGKHRTGCLHVKVLSDNGAPARVICAAMEYYENPKLNSEILRLKAVFDGAAEAVGMSDAKGAHFYHNEAFTRLFGYSVAEMRNIAPGSLYCDEALASHVFKTIMGGGSWEGELEMHHKDGHTMNISLRATGVKNTKGKVIALIGHHTDITEKLHTIEQLAQSQAKYKDFVENAPIGMLVTDLDSNVIYANKKMEEITGYHRTDWVHNKYVPFVHEEDLPMILQQRAHAVKTRAKIKPYEVRMHHSSGEIRWLRAIPQLIFGNGGQEESEVIGFQNFLEDVTPTKQAIEEKKRLEKQLAQSQKMEAIGTMAGGIAHDFNNILYPIMGYAELVMEDLEKDSITYRNVAEIVKSAHRAKDLVQQILSFSRQSETQVVPVALQTVLDDVLKMVRAVFPSTIQIKRRISRKCRMIQADTTQIHQVIMNLCTNAYHAMMDSGGVLRVLLTEETIYGQDTLDNLSLDDGVYARVTISDSGTGMSKEVMERIFEPYFTTKVHGEGTGLGLATVHAIVEKHGGGISVQSEQGKGSTFDVYFPIIKGVGASMETLDASPIPRGTESLLLVDDEESILNMLGQMLHRFGYRVSCHLDSKEALAAYSRAPSAYDLVVTDLTMPKMTGTTLAKELMKVTPNLPIILCTGFSEKVNKEQVEKMGIAAYLTKPVVFQELGATIHRLLKSRKKDLH